MLLARYRRGPRLIDKKIVESFDKDRKPEEEIDREKSSVEVKGRMYNV